ncbi:MAG: hypothetical protein HPY62_04645 [Bacteroidales bacterium]|nr:hypothetical protein [Bacteroidales bacterium]
MRSSITFVLLLLIVLAPSCRNIREKGLFGRKAKALAVLKAQQDSLRVADSLRKIQIRLQALEEARLDSIRAAEEERRALEARLKYNIVVGAFITPEYARAWMDEYKAMGYSPEIIKPEGSRFELVVAESHERFSKAVQRLEQFHDTVNIDAWLYVRK